MTVNNSVFKAVDVDVKDEPVPVSTSLKLPQANSTPSSHHLPNQKTVDQKKSRGKGSQWKAPWLNLDQRNKQRNITENVVKPEATVQTSKPRDVASILQNKLDAGTADVKEPMDAQSPTTKPESVRTITGNSFLWRKPSES